VTITPYYSDRPNPHARASLLNGSFSPFFVLLQEYSRQVPTAEGAAFAARTGCLFVEASAKTAVGVTETFSEVVERIIDTPSLWGDEKPKASSSKAGVTSRPQIFDSMPGNIDLGQVQDEGDSGGCAC
jgi:Ras-related protein Rab-18